MANQSPVVIAGAGPVGLFCAVQLVEAGVPVLLLEQADRLMQDMRASTFHPATLDLLHRYGLAEPLCEIGTAVPVWQYMTHANAQAVKFDLSVLSDVTGFPYRLQAEQYLLTQLIEQRYRSHPLLDFRKGARVCGLEQNENTVTVSWLSNGMKEQFEGAWAIAADGGRSTVRGLMGLAFEGSVFPKTSITVVLDCPFEKHFQGLLGVNYVWTDEAHYSLMKVRDNWRFTYAPNAAECLEESVSKAAVELKLQSLFADIGSYQIKQINHYTLHQRCLRSFRQGRVLFAGDAAHLNSPAGGMGMNSGLHDAVCLVGHLIPVIDGEEESTLDRYDRRRRTIALDEVQRLSARNYQWHRETDPLKRQGIWQEMNRISSNANELRDFLLESSMINSLQREAEIA